MLLAVVVEVEAVLPAAAEDVEEEALSFVFVGSELVVEEAASEDVVEDVASEEEASEEEGNSLGFGHATLRKRYLSASAVMSFGEPVVRSMSLSVVN